MEKATCKVTNLSFRRKHRIFLKTQGHCYYCGIDLFDTSWQVEHMLPVVKGGTDDESNLVPSCSSCNRKKSSNDVDQFRDCLKDRVADRACNLHKAAIELTSFVSDVEPIKKIGLLIDDILNVLEEVKVEFYGDNSASEKKGAL